MPKPLRKLSKSSIEALEARRSLTSFVVAANFDGNETDSVEVATQIAPHARSDSPAGGFLLYVSALDDVTIERPLPSIADCLAVDHLIAETNPPFDS